jgi:hypothetical protein
MTQKSLNKSLSRRKFLGSTAAGVALAGTTVPSVSFGAAKTVKICPGFTAARSGPSG